MTERSSTLPRQSTPLEGKMPVSNRLILGKYPGGKSKIARWVSGHFPEHDRYVEGFAGMSSVLLNKPRCPSEWLVERDAAQATLLRVVRDRGSQLVAWLSRYRHCRDTYDEAVDRLRRGEWGNDLELAGLVYLRRQLSRGGEERSYGDRARRDVPAWWRRCLGLLPRVGDRLRGVQIIEGDALEWLPLLDGPDVLSYCDPPYPWEARTGFRPYRHEMGDDEHRELLRVLDGMAGHVALSGYPCRLYDATLAGWHRDEIEVPLFAQSKGVRLRRTEVLWMNYGGR
jgi:DNA adenine methylase